MRAAFRGLLALAAVVVATVVMESVLPGASGSMDLYLLVVVYYAISGSRERAIVMGALAGLTQDIFTSQFLGFHTFVKTAVAYLVAGLGSRFMLNQPLPRLMALVLATLLDGGLAALLASLAGLPLHVGVGSLTRLALINGILGMPILAAVSRGMPGRRRR